MTTNIKTANGGGRPRQFQNEDVFQATTQVLLRVGYGSFTLDAVAREAGCSAPAISKRFGSKSGLLRAYLEWSKQRIQARFRSSREMHGSPLAALRARYQLPVEERPEEFGAFAGFTEMLNDPELGPIIVSRRSLWEGEISAILAAAQDQGELARCDIAALAHTLHAALAGAMTLWNPDVDGPVIDVIATVLDTIIDPYRKAAADHSPSTVRATTATRGD